VMAQLKARRVRKTYLALAQGSVGASVGPDRGADRPGPEGPQADGRGPERAPAITGYRVRERFAGWTLLELDLVTGRTHQIRVHPHRARAPGRRRPGATGPARHAAGPDGLERLFLHAWRLELVSPRSAKLVRAEAPLPDALETVLEGLRGGRGIGGSAPAGRGRVTEPPVREGAPAPCSSSSAARPGWARTRSSTRSASAAPTPTTTTSSRAPLVSRARARCPACRTSS
jgi:hypothetical protein